MTRLHEKSRDCKKSHQLISVSRRMIFPLKMTTRSLSVLIFVAVLVAVIDGYGLQAKFAPSVPTLQDCMKPPMGISGHECCRLPKERIWGDLRGSLNVCMRKFKEERRSMRQEAGDGGEEMATPEGSEIGVSTEDPSESAYTPSTSPRSTTAGYPKRRRRPHWKKPISERLKDLFSSLYKEIKNTFDVLWQSVMIITDHLHRHPNDSCYMECVFEDQGFVVNKMLNKEALLSRLSLTLGKNEPWRLAAVAAVETCHAELQLPSNNTCHSGSEEIFRCIFKQLFFNCPTWLQNEHCKSLREFYRKCPNGPPPETTEPETTASPEEGMESVTATEIDRYVPDQ